MFRLGLCCQFAEHDVKFRTTTAAALSRMPRGDALRKVSDIALYNARSLLDALGYCSGHGIGCFRVQSQILPVKTHPEAGYSVGDLAEAEEVRAAFDACREFARDHNLRLTFHPDQFVVLGSPREEVVASSVGELEYQAEVAEWIGADVLNVHGGGAYGDKAAALDRLRRNLNRLSARVRKRMTLENDDRVFTPADLLPLCRTEGIPLVYDVHHHRCLPDGCAVEEATAAALGTWNREPLFHVSSPKGGWGSSCPRKHDDFISEDDVPRVWDELPITVEVEAKLKEVAIARLQGDLAARGMCAVPKGS